jgi:aspartate carbamoyltransferase catalytic subunit
VINAGDGTHQHPTQALLDAFTLRRRLVGRDADGADTLGQDLTGRRVTLVGDILHSRVARSNVDLLHTLGAQVTLVAPPTLLPVGVAHWPCEVSYDLDAVLPKSDAVMMLRVQRERMNAAYFPTEREYSRRYGLDASRMAKMPGHAIVMHPGPMVRGMEITAEVADSDRCTVVEQVTNGVSIRMAVLYLLLGGNEPVATPHPSGERPAATTEEAEEK